MNHILDYYKERGAEVIQNNDGFVIYWLSEQEAYVEIVYIKPSARRTNAATKLTKSVENIARSSGLQYLTTTVNLNKGNPEVSTMAILRYGFKILKADEDAIYFGKELKNGKC